MSRVRTAPLGSELFHNRHGGFALIEIAVALFVISILMAAILVPITTQVQQRKISDTQRILEESKDALMGFVVANGRFPCPASAASNGIEDPVGGGTCTHPYDGFLPAATIGFTASDGSGYSVDAWNSRIRYAVTQSNSKAFTTTGQMKAATIAALLPDLKVCSTASASTTSCQPANTAIATNAVAVIYSLGPNSLTPTGGIGLDEASNPNPNTATAPDQVFVWHPPSASGAANGEFDDIVTWISPYVLYSRMVNAGMLP